MTSELVPYHPRDIVDGWATQLAHVVELTKYIADSTFVPEAYRGNPPAIAAAILAGREAGLGPMTSLQHIHMIQGRPALSANMQRALVQAAGHTITYTETTSTRCVARGHRQHESEWTTVTWTLDDARAQGLDRRDQWRRMPRQMLIARATSELCRLIASDALQGMPYSREELADTRATDLDADPATTQPEPAQRTIRRQTAITAVTSRTPQGAGAKSEEPHPLTEAEAPTSEPPLPGDPNYDDPEEVTADPDKPDPEENPEQPGQRASKDLANPRTADEPATRPQIVKANILLGDLGVADDRDQKLRIIGQLVGHPVTSSKDMTLKEANAVIDTLERITQSTADPGEAAANLQHFLDALNQVNSTT
jgi:hypothetical protein